MPGSVFRRRPPVFHIDVPALGFLGGTNARVPSCDRGIPASLTRRPAGEKEEESDSLSLVPCLGARHRGQPYAGSDKKHSGDGQRLDHACLPCGGNQMKGQKIPSSRLTMDIVAPQQLPGFGEVFQHLRHSYRLAIGPLPGEQVDCSISKPDATEKPAIMGRDSQIPGFRFYGGRKGRPRQQHLPSRIGHQVGCAGCSRSAYVR
jgi:hypothetical protein